MVLRNSAPAAISLSTRMIAGATTNFYSFVNVLNKWVFIMKIINYLECIH